MKVRDGFMLHEVAGQWVIVPLGERVVKFNGIMMLSESGSLLWKLLEKDASAEELVQALLTEYCIDAETAQRDVQEFIEDIREKELIE
ncbi:PqqD family protein [Desulfosporosinus meridiei]|uniref:Coenzyme PQQ synthesis protein D (PqqD) n=1 Tax=Desulfosporosinus meridiei (strain ATCC BAA-275 / DSM 13257 / KCTC 12902 / NCIMB 13706 / S10) TaxID=768704 RepID=J7J0S8_DESMD|nr:PqqD family protein [Desulfosporosinus meridiei]AFQ45964.1 Coenzyme PQQ synthesis protein D (PqqD) [Desulfosporosinus meridiei DSM 13257]